MPIYKPCAPRAILFALAALAITASDAPSPSATQAIPAPTPINPVVSQTIGGITVGLQPLHVDAHRVVLGVGLEGPAQPYSYEFGFYGEPDATGKTPTLSADGIELPRLADADISSWGYSDIAQDGQPLLWQGTLTFDSSMLKRSGSAPSNLSLHLALPVYVNNTPYFPPQPVPTRSSAPTETPTQVPPASYPLLFSFSIATPFDERHKISQIGQTVDNNNVRMTLNSLDITASEARMALHYTILKPDPLFGGWMAAGILKASSGGQESDTFLIGSPDSIDSGNCTMRATESDCIFTYSGPSLLDKPPADYALEINAYDESGMSSMGQGPTSYGFWAFHFTLP